jgi:dTDP-4-dehydrorhamnose 3,5-epimerase
MRFSKTAIDDVLLIDFDAAEDERGFFARTFCEEEFALAGLAMHATQINQSHNRHAFTLRGLHYQAAPHGETKIVQCVRGRIFDVAVDLRRESPSYLRWIGVELTPESRQLVFIPEGCAHGFLTLEALSDLVYVMGSPFVPEAARGVRWDDPAFGITWPATPRVISERDSSFADFMGAPAIYRGLRNKP